MEVLHTNDILFSIMFRIYGRFFQLLHIYPCLLQLQISSLCLAAFDIDFGPPASGDCENWQGEGGDGRLSSPPAPGIFWGFLKKFSVRPGAMRLWGMRDKKMWETCVYSPLQNSQKYIAICRLRGSLCLKRLTKKKYNYWMRFKRRKNSFIWVKFI